MKKYIDNLLINDACHQDIDFIISLIRESSRDGHFAEEYWKCKSLDSLKYQLTLVIDQQIMPINNGFLKANLYVLKDTQKNNIGFSWVRYHTINECEIYLFAIAKNVRYRGYGKYFFQFLLSAIQSSRIYVDLYKKSTYMKNIVIKNNFQFEKYNYSGAERYVKNIVFKSEKTIAVKQKDNILQMILKIFKI